MRRLERWVAAGVIAGCGALAQAQTAPPIHGLAHVAYGVSDLGKTTAFYEKLGFQVAFQFGEGAAVSQVFLKINDRQFLELYPVKPGAKPGLLHLCFDVDAAEALHDVYVRRGLQPIDVRKARAGNLLFTLQGPEKENVEYTQYMAGSLHTNDTGKHLGGGRIADELMAVGLPFADRDAARTFFLQRLSFDVVAGRPWEAELPGASTEDVLFQTGGERARLYLRIAGHGDAAAELNKRGVAAREVPGALEVTDPDGNPIELESSHIATPVGSADGR